MTETGTTGDQPVNVEYQENVPQEQVQDNPTWDTGTEKEPPPQDKEAYWDKVSDEGDPAAEDGPAS